MPIVYWGIQIYMMDLKIYLYNNPVEVVYPAGITFRTDIYSSSRSADMILLKQDDWQEKLS
jgi:hypothetical protein